MLLRTIIGKAKILIVDDESANVRLLERILEMIGCPAEQVHSTLDSTRAVDLFCEFRPDLVLLDLHMPEPDGFTLLEQFKAISSAPGFDTDGGPGTPVPVLVLTADVNPKTKHRALSHGARDFLTKPIDQPEVILRIKNLLENRFLQIELQDQNDRLEVLVRERTGQLEESLIRLREAQQNAIKHERLNALGTMAAGVAHDFNNALTLIHGYGELLLAATTKSRGSDPTPSSSPERSEVKYVRTIMMAARDAANVVTRLRAFYRPPDDGAEVRLEVHLGQLIDQAITMTAPRWLDEVHANGLTIHVRRDIETLPALQGDPAELREMFTNLIFNAVDAMPAGGTITLRARAGEGGRAVLLEVADDGIGMSEETRRRCLEPFFTTKGEKGTGLGLSAVYGIIQRHGGTIDIQSESCRGTRFLIRLPVTLAEAGTATQHGQENGSAAAGENGSRDPARALRILVVDDQPVVRSLLEEHLVQDGHHIATAANGAEALVKFHAEPYELLLTDQAMPGMNGEALAAAVKEARPGTPVILLTGFGEMIRAKTDLSDHLHPGVDLILNKPVSILELRRAIAQVIAH